MGARKFGVLVDKVMQERGLTQARLAVLVGVLPDGRVLNETQVRRIREGQRRLDPDLIHRLVEVLGLDEGEAWHTAGLWPPDLDVDSYRRYRRHLAAVGATSHQRDPKNGRFSRRAGERRRRDRRHLWVVPPAA